MTLYIWFNFTNENIVVQCTSISNVIFLMKSNQIVVVYFFVNSKTL